MRTQDKKNNGVVHYLKVEVNQEGEGKVEGYMLSGSKELLKKVLVSHKDVIKALSPLRQGDLSSKGKKDFEDVDLEVTAVLCEEIREYII